MKTFFKLVLALVLAAALGAGGLFLLMFASRLWDRPPSPTTRHVSPADLVGTYRYPLQLQRGQVALTLKPDSTFTEAVTPAGGEAPFTVEGRWYVLEANVVLDKLWMTDAPQPSLPPARDNAIWSGGGSLMLSGRKTVSSCSAGTPARGRKISLCHGKNCNFKPGRSAS